MRIKDYRRLLRDRVELARTLGKLALKPFLTDELSFRKGEVAETVERFHPKRVAVTVTGVRQETPSTKTFVLAPKRGTFPPFQAGQYVNVFVTVDGVRTSRPYSISSPSTRLGTIELTVKMKREGFVSPHMLDRAAVGDEFEVSGPAGSFHYNPLRDTKELVFVAGGSGIAPFVGMAEDIIQRGSPVSMTLLYGSNAEDDIIFRERLDALAKANDNFEVVHVLSAPSKSWRGAKGFIDRKRLLRHLRKRDLGDKTFFLCGPEPMYLLVMKELLDLGVRKRRIRVEAFGPPEDVSADPGWPDSLSMDTVFEVAVEGRNKRIPAVAGEPLMNSLERAGLVVPALCRAGTCGTCRTRLLSGKVFVPAGAALRDTDHEAGFIHPCLSYPTSDLEIRLP